MINKKRLLQEFLRLISIKSLSLEEKPVMQYLAKQLQALGLKPGFDRADKILKGNSGNLFCVVPGDKKSPRLLINAHVDTVGPEVSTRSQRKGNFMVGNGRGILGADDKAGVAIILEVLRILKEKDLPHGDLLIVLTVAEEVGLLGARALAAKKLKADFGIALDGGSASEIVYKAPSQKNFEVEVFGKAAHAGIHPEEGVNAIYVASCAIAKIENWGRVDHETTCNIGIKKGGHATNIVPEHAWVKGEVRSHRPHKLNKQLQHIKRNFMEIARREKAKVKVKVTPMYDSFEVKPTSGPIKLIARAMHKVGLSPTFRITGGGSDANIFNKHGVPTVVMGVGMERVHTSRERLNLHEFETAAELLLEIVKEAGWSHVHT